jgi:integrase
MRVPNPGRRCREQRPFDSWEQVRSLADRLGPSFGPMVVFAAATGLRPSELFALEHGDIDRAAGVVQIRRAYANGRVKHTKTRLSRRAVPLQAIALEALDQRQSRQDSLLLFPNARGGHLDFRNFNRRHGSPSRKQPGSSRCATSTTCATPTPPSRSVPASRCSLSHGSWARASR